MTYYEEQQKHYERAYNLICKYSVSNKHFTKLLEISDEPKDFEKNVREYLMDRKKFLLKYGWEE